ncbi:MAG: hypothetical protein M3Z85_05355, partial [Acidobacteriota bacterium]|nr:hypothetical protein [Acidobacteriota bacterium]
LSGAAPGGGLMVTLMSNDQNKLLFSANATDAGTATLMLTIPAGQNRTQDFFVQGLASSGNVTYTAMAPGFGTGTGTITLTPSAITIAGPFGPGSFPTAVGMTSTITVKSVQLTGGAEVLQQVRGNFSATVNIGDSKPAVGTVSPSSLTIGGGGVSATTTFTANSPGSTVLSVDVPAGFSAPPAADASVTANVSLSGIAVTTDAQVGMNLEIQGSLLLGSTAPPGLMATLTSNDPSNLLFSATPDGAGKPSIMIPVSGNNATYYIQVRASSGSGTYTATAGPGYGTGMGTITYGPSGVVLQGPFGYMFPFSTTVGTPKTLTVFTDLLDASGNRVQDQQLAGGLSLTVMLNSSVPGVGTITPQVTIAGGTDHADAQFTPVAKGSTVLSVLTPAGYTAASAAFTTITANVN